MTPGPPLRLRRPAWRWVSAGLLVGPVVGPIPVALMVSPLSFASASGPLDALIRILQTIGMFAAFGLAASLLLGAPWALLTHRRARRSRGRVIVETLIVALIFALAASLAWAFSGVIREGAEAGWASAAALAGNAAYFALLLWFYASFVTAWVAPVAGAALAWIAFTRAPADAPQSRA